MGRLVSELLNHFRNLLIFQVSRGDLKLIEASEAEAAAPGNRPTRLHCDALTRMLEVLTDCEGRLRDTASKKILVEVALLKMIEARNAVSIDTVLQQVQKLRAEAARRRRPRPPPLPSRAAPAAKPATAARPRRRSAPGDAATWASFGTNSRRRVGRASPFVKSYFLEAHAVSFDKNVLTIGFDPEYADHLPLVDNSKNHALVQHQTGGIGPSQRPGEIHPGRRAAARKNHAAPAPRRRRRARGPRRRRRRTRKPAPRPQEDFKNDPLIQKALEIFKGQIAEVR